VLRWVFQFALVAIFPAISVAAQTRDIQPEVRALAEYTVFFEEFEQTDKREGLIRALQAYCAGLERVFPKNSPSEEAWLSGEMQSSDYGRITRVVESAEWGRRMASNFLVTCSGFTDNYLKFPEQRTVSLFVLIEATAKFHGDAPIYARKNGVDPDRWGFIVLGSTIRALSNVGAWETGKLFKRSPP